MIGDEAPAATIGGVNENGMRPPGNRLDQQGLGLQFPRNSPISLVAAEIHLGRRPAGICVGWLHCNIQVACHTDGNKILRFFNML
jgi:hypothetical protein